MRQWIVFIIALSFCSVSLAGGNLRLTNSNWIPYKNPGIEGGGLVTEITLEALKRAGYQVQVVNAPWKRALVETYEGNSHVLPAVWKTPEREAKLLFSDPVLPTRLVLVSHKKYEHKYQSLKDLKGERVGTSRGWAYPDDVKNADYFKTEEATDLEINLKKIVFERIKVAFAEEYAARYTAKSKLGDQASVLNFSPVSLSDRFLHVAISKKHPQSEQILAKFNDAIRSMRNDGSYDQILSKHIIPAEANK